MQSRRQSGVTLVLLLLLYGGAVRCLSLLAPPAGAPAQAQGYPGPSATHDGYPPPLVVASATPSPTQVPTRTRVSPTPTATSTSRIGLTPTTRAGATAIGVPPATVLLPRSTPGAPLLLPPTVTPRELPATGLTAEQPPPDSSGVAGEEQAPPSLETSSAAVAVPAPPLADPSEPAESDAPYLDLVPPLAGERTGPGMPLTLLAGTALAAAAWWVHRRWLSPRPPVSPENPQDQA